VKKYTSKTIHLRLEEDEAAMLLYLMRAIEADARSGNDFKKLAKEMALVLAEEGAHGG